MREHRIILDRNMVKEFVARAGKCDFDIDVSYNHITVDAKSMLGVLALDLRQILTVSCNGYSEDFENYLAALCVAA